MGLPMKGNGRFKLNRSGLKQLSERAQTSKAMENIGDKVVAQIDDSGRFTKGYRSEARTVNGTAGARVGTDYPFAHWDEWGTRRRAPRAPLRRALQSTGLIRKTKTKGKP